MTGMKAKIPLYLDYNFTVVSIGYKIMGEMKPMRLTANNLELTI
jgi:hypothetical protein